MNIALKNFYDEVDLGNIKASEFEDYVLFNYTNECVFSKSWNDTTLASRGIIFDKNTGECIALPFPKFFNLSEHPTTQFNVLPHHLPYEVFEKADGSLGILYWHKDIPRIATRGSFQSDQAKIGIEILGSKDLTTLDRDLTLLFEIIYPENRFNDGARLVVDYGSTKDLILLGAYNRKTGVELTREEVENIAKCYNFPIVKKYNYTIEQVIEMQKILPPTQEGFVVRYSNGLRLKCKGDEYLKLSKILNSITPLNIWECFDSQLIEVNRDYLMSIPEEFRDEVTSIERKIKQNGFKIGLEIRDDYRGIPAEHKVTRKDLGLYLQSTGKSLRHRGAMFLVHLGKIGEINEYIREAVKPKGNILIDASFKERCKDLRGDALNEAFDQAHEDWNVYVNNVEVYEFMGLTQKEYRHIVQDPSCLEKIMTDQCVEDVYHSCVCKLGTKCCIVNHRES